MERVGSGVEGGGGDACRASWDVFAQCVTCVAVVFKD